MSETLLRYLRQPEYIHTLLNPLPIYGLGLSLLGLLIALVQRSGAARTTTLILIALCAASAWPVYEMGEQGYDRVLSMTDDDGHAWLDEHQHRAERLIYFYYAVALLAAAALFTRGKWAVPVAASVLIFGLLVLGMGGYIAYAGGKIRHREFRNEPPPKSSTPST